LGILPRLRIPPSSERIFEVRWAWDGRHKFWSIKEDEHYYYIPVQRTRSVHDATAHIYDLMVAEDESFVVGNMLVKNSTPYKYAYMGLIWIGKVKAGVQRDSLHEYFFYPDEKLPKLNREFYDGRFIFRCFKQPGGPKWWAWKARENPLPLNPTCHCDQGFYEPIKAEEVKHFGKESYPEWEEVKEICEGEED